MASHRPGPVHPGPVGGLAFTVVITTSLAYGVGSSVTLLGILLWVLGAAIIAFTPRALRASAARRRN